jgi:hypothetical protein
MDKFKKVLAVLKKYHFWVATVVVLLVTVVCWWLATAGLASQFQTRKKKLEGDFGGVKKIQRNDPNNTVVQAIETENKALKEKVLQAWDILYRQQKEKNPIPKFLGEEFKQQFESLNLKAKEELELANRERYQNFIVDQYLPSLLKLVDVRRPAEASEAAPGDARPAAGGRAADKEAGAARRGVAAGVGRAAARVLGAAGPAARMPGMGGLGGANATDTEEEWIGAVDWNPTDIQSLETRFTWKDSTPSTLAVVLAQEDLWVIEALLRVIAETNGKGATYATAAVKRIEALQIGRDAVARGGEDTIFRAGGAQAGGGMGGPGGGMPGMGGPAMGGMGGPGMGRPGTGGPGIGGPGMPGMGGPAMGGPGMAGAPGMGGTGAAGADDSRLIEGRYVDGKGLPLSAEAEFPYAKHPFAEFKMMPIRMNLVMDQRRIPRLLVACANSNMPIEVQRVRIKGHGSSGAAVAAAPMGGGMMGGRGGMDGMLGGRGGVGGQSPAADSHESQLDVPVEIYGVIYIYNPPDREKLGTGAASTEKTADGGAAAAAAPAGTPASGTPARPDAAQPANATPAAPVAPAAQGAPAAVPGAPAGPPAAPKAPQTP